MEKAGKNAVEHLHPEACWDLLRRDTVGRLAVVVEHRPDIFPINYVVDGETLVFRSAAGSKFWAALDVESALEVDGYEPRTQMAWSVVVHGHIRLVLDELEKRTADSLGLQPWEPGEKNIYLRLIPGSITGRRFHTVEPDIWKISEVDRRRSAFE
jgi:uncharacterized protein